MNPTRRPTAAAGRSAGIGLLFTRYPVLSETFLLREVHQLRRTSEAFFIYPLWPGGDRIAGAPPATARFGPLHLLSLFFWIPYWALLRPRAMQRLATALTASGPRSALSVWENLLGMGYGLVRARALHASCGHLHAVWASAPASAAWTIHLLTGMSFSMAGHAYDLFEHGGDWLLREKLQSARFVRTSTEAGRRRLLALGAPPEHIRLIRRGVDVPPLPHPRPPRPVTTPLRLLSVGRMVEKMGHSHQLAIAAALAARNVPFHLRIIGDGPLRRSLQRRAQQFGLQAMIEFSGALPHSDVIDAYAQADLFLFTGCVAASGDRAGLPNVIGEAMAAGLPVLATPVGAVTEAIEHGSTGWILSGNAARDADLIQHLAPDSVLTSSCRRNAHRWVKHHFQLATNAAALAAALTSNTSGVDIPAAKQTAHLQT